MASGQIERIALLTGSLPPHDVCGVGDYTKRLHEALIGKLPVELVHRPISRAFEPGLFHIFRDRDLVHVEYPTEGWGNSVLPSFLPLGRRLLGPRAKLVVTLHEWSQMNPIRRKSILPLVTGADAFVFVTPFERDAFLSSAPRSSRSKPTWVIPIGVNLTVPEVPREEALAFRQEELAGSYDLLLTHFGFVHEAKQPRKILDALVALRALGRNPKMVFIGGFQTDKPQEREAFEREISSRGLTEAVDLKGFIKDDRVAAKIMAAGDANVSLFAEGLSSRRGSFWYATQHGTSLVTTEPRDWREFERVKEWLVPPQVQFVSPEASGEEIAQRLLALPPYEPFRYGRVPVEDWDDIAERHREMYRQLLG